MKSLEAHAKYLDSIGQLLSLTVEPFRESTTKIPITEKAPPGLVPFQARIMAAYPTKSLNNRIYTKELLQGVPPLYVGKPFILDHNIENVDVITGLVTGAKYGIDETADGSQKEALWLNTVGYMDEKLFAKMKGSGIIPPFIKGVSIGGEGEGDYRADGGIMIKKFLPAEISMTGFPGLPEAHVAQLNQIRESYRSQVSNRGEKTTMKTQEVEVSAEDAEKQAAKENQNLQKIIEGPVPPADSRKRVVRGAGVQNDVRPGLPAPTSQTNQTFIQPAATTSSVSGIALDPQNPAGINTSDNRTRFSQGVATGVQGGPAVAAQTGPVPQRGGVQAGPYGSPVTINVNPIASPGPSNEQIPGTVPGPSNTGPDAMPYTPGGIVSAATTTNMPAGPISTTVAAQAVGMGTADGPRGSPNSPMTYVNQTTPWGQVGNASTTAMTAPAQPTSYSGNVATGSQPQFVTPVPGYFMPAYNFQPTNPALGTTTTATNTTIATGNPSQSSNAVAQSDKTVTKTREDTAEDGAEEDEEEEEEEEEAEENEVDPVRKAAGQGQNVGANPIKANQTITDVIPIQASAPSILWNKSMDQVLSGLVPKQKTKESTAPGVPTKSVTALPSLPFANQYTVDPTADYQRGKALLSEETDKPSSNMGSPAQRAFQRLMAEKGLR